MSILILLTFIVMFIVIDFGVRAFIKSRAEKRLRRRRQEALSVSLNLDYTHDAKTLKRVEVKNPKATILAVDDETIILDSLRKILVLDGYSVDTVENGSEALGLIQKRHYDFVFTDLKMPGMDGVDVCKAVKHLRPDIDVIIITGFASVESAIETMKFGAMDYVEKPFTENELLAMVNTFNIRRNDRIAKQLRAKVSITSSASQSGRASVAFTIPGGVFVSTNHCWASLSPKGDVEVGMDDFATKIIGQIDAIEFPDLGMTVQQGELLFRIKQGARSVPFKSPLQGQIVAVNKSINDRLDWLKGAYGKNWLCRIEPTRLESDLRSLKIGQSAVALFDRDIARLHDYLIKNVTATDDENSIPADGHIYLGELAALKDKDFNAIVDAFFERDSCSDRELAQV